MQAQPSVVSPTLDPAQSRASSIASQNDAFRRALLTYQPTSIPGRAVLTHTFANLPLTAIRAIMAAIAEADEFLTGNDPYGEHDFGCVEGVKLGAGERVFWKIDYYSDTTCQFGSEDPNDPTQTYRLLTIMLASDY